MTTLKLTQIGNSVGLILPKEILARLKLGKGDTVFVTDAVNGVTLTPYNPAFDAQMTAARAVMKRRRHALRELASGVMDEAGFAGWLRQHSKSLA